MSDGNEKKKPVETTMSKKQLIGAGAGIVALIALLVFGRTFSTTKEAEMLVATDVPTVSEYQADSVELDAVTAAGNEYEIGRMVTVEAELDDPLTEPVLGAANVVLEMSDKTVESQSDTTIPVVLVFSDAATAEQADGGLVMGRYIGSVTIENDLGAEVTAPAIQVDHLQS